MSLLTNKVYICKKLVSVIYQLPTGKIISISVEEYLNLTEDDIDLLISINFGNYPNSTWTQSVIETFKEHRNLPQIDSGIDYDADAEEISKEYSKVDIVYLEELGDEFLDTDFSELSED